MHNLLCQNVPIFLLHTLHTRRINTFWSDGIDIYWSGAVEHFDTENHKQKISNIHKDILCYTNFS